MQEPTTIRPLTGLRGVLALWVVLLHITLALELNGFSVADRLSPHAARLMLSGIIAVDGFFILSGFILAYAHAHEFTRVGPGLWRRCLQFWALRLARIYPTHVAVLAAYAALPLIGIALPLASCGNPFNRPIPCDRFSLAHLSDQLLLIASWGVDPVIGWNLPAWSVSSEWFVYLLFPVLVVPAMRLGARGAALAAVSSLAIMSVLAALFLPRFLGLADDYGLVRAVPKFFCGCCLYRVWAAEGTANLPWPTVGAVAALIMLAALAFGIVPQVSVFCLGVVILALTGARQGWLGWVLSTAPLQWLGRVSYSLYLTHLLAIELIGYAISLQAKANPFKTPWIGVRAYLALLVLTLVVALLFNLAIEEPARRHLRGLLARRQRSAS